jgi:O-antigen/teichoic acid export membrane protein
MICLLTWVSSPLVARFFGENDLARYLPLTGTAFLVGAFGTQFQVLFQKELRFNLLAVQEILAACAGGGIAIGLALAGFGVWSMVWGVVAQAVVRTVVIAIPGWLEWRPGFHFAARDLKGFVGFGSYQMGERTINYFNLRVDQLLIGALLGVQALGYYSFASNLTLQPQMKLNQVVNKVVFPVFSRVQDEEILLQRGYLKVLKVLTTLNAPMLVGLVLVAPIGVPLVFGEQWNAAVVLVQILSLFTLVRSTGSPIGNLLLAKGRADLGFYWNLGLLVLIVPVVAGAAVLGGLTAIAFALLLMQIILSFGTYRFLALPLIGKCGGAYAAAILKPVLLACIMGVAVFAVSFLWGSARPTVTLIGQVFVGLSVYTALVSFADRDIMNELRLALGGENA